MSAWQFGRIARALLAVEVGAFFVTATLAAQSPLGGTAHAYAGNYPNGRGQPIVGCFQSIRGPSLNPVLAGGSCQGAPAAAAYARRGVIGAYTSSTPEEAYVGASWSDIVSWSNPLVSSIAFSFQVKGQVEQPAPYVSVGYSFSYGFPPQRRSGWKSFNYGMPPDPFVTVLWQTNAPVAGLTSLPFEYSLAMLSAWSLADFWQGTGLTSLAFLDAQGNAIPDVSYHFAAGTQFLDTQPPPPLSFTPEPATLTLVGTALAGLLGALRRRGRARGSDNVGRG